MGKLRKIFRNPSSDFLFIIGLVISCVILLNVVELISKIVIEENATNKYKFTSGLLMNGEISESESYYIVDHLLECLDKLSEGNIYISRGVYIDSQKDERCKAFILMKNNEELLFEFKEGGYIKDEEYKNAVIIGESLKEYIVDDDGNRYINIDGEQFNIIGILKNNMSAGVDKSLYILWETMDTEKKEVLMTGDVLEIFMELYYESNICESYLTERLENDLAQYQVDFEEYIVENKHTDERMNDIYKKVKSILLCGALAFSIVVCCSVSYIWLLERMRELSIRKAYGYSNRQIFMLLFKDTLYLMLLALVISVMAQIIFNALLNKDLVSEGLFLFRIIVVFIGAFCIVVINTLYLMNKMKKFRAVMINERN